MDLMQIMFEESHWIILILLVCVVKVLVPKMLDSENPNVQFGIGVVIFLIYTAALLIALSYLNVLNVENISQELDRVYMIRFAVAILLCSLSALFAACLYFFSREKRKLSQRDKMKLKDL